MTDSRDHRRIRPIALVGAWASGLFAVALSVSTCAYVWTRPFPELVAPLGFRSVEHADAWQIVGVRALACGSTLVASAALLALVAGFRAIAAGRYFGEATTRALIRFSILCVTAIVVSVATPPASSLLMSMGGSEGHVVLSVGSGHGIALLFTLTVYLLAWLLREAARIERENNEIV